MMTTAHESMSLQPVQSMGARRSLNRDQRKRELMKITKENQLILKRLQDKSANYNVQKWENENQQRQKVLQNICEYPLLAKDAYQQPDFIIRKKNKSASSNGGGFYKRKAGYASGNNPM